MLVDENKQSPLLEVRNLCMDFVSPRTIVDMVTGQSPKTLHAVRNLSFSVNKGEILGIVGESGCGKSTLGRCLVGLHQPTSGDIFWKGQSLSSSGSRLDISKKIQMIFQDPYSSLNPRMTIAQILEETLHVHGFKGSASELNDRVDELLLTVGLAPRLKDRLPYALSGGQRQRVSIGRALAVGSELIVADEPVSALDASVQAQIINLFEEIKEKFNVSFIFIAHNLSVVRHISERIAVLYLGQCMETADADELFAHPSHPYTQALLSSIPSINPEQRNDKVMLEGELPNPFSPPDGCAFSTRCPHVTDACRQAIPAMTEYSHQHFVRCIHTV